MKYINKPCQNLGYCFCSNFATQLTNSVKDGKGTCSSVCNPLCSQVCASFSADSFDFNNDWPFFLDTDFDDEDWELW